MTWLIDLFLWLALLGLVLLQVFGWSKFRRREAPGAVAPPPEQGLPSISFLVPAWNSVDDVPRFVAAFDAVELPDKELIICAGGHDDTYETAVRFAGENVVVLKQEPGDGKQVALAKCFADSRGEIIFLTDIDCRPDADGLWRVLRPLCVGEQGVVTGGLRPLDEQLDNAAVLANWATDRHTAGTTARYVDGLLGGNSALQRQVINDIGGFVFEAPTGTDYRMAQKLVARGHRIWFEPAAEMRTEFAWPLGSYVRQRARWLKTVALNAERPRQIREYRGAIATMAMPFALAALFAYAVLWVDLAATVLLFALVLHALLNRIRYALESLPRENLSVALLPGSLVSFFGTLGAGAMAVRDLVTPTMRRRW